MDARRRRRLHEADVRRHVPLAVAEHGFQLVSLRAVEPSLEDIYRHAVARTVGRRSPVTARHADRGRAAERAAARSIAARRWMVIARKEFADHILSARFFVLLLLLRVVAAVPLYLTADVIRSAAAGASGGQAIFIALFWYTPPLPLLANEATLPSVAGFFGLVAPLLGLSFGFDAVNGERARARCRGCCPSRSTATT